MGWDLYPLLFRRRNGTCPKEMHENFGSTRKHSREAISVRRDTATKRELERILSDEQHPCRKHLPVEHKISVTTKITNREAQQ